MSNVWDVSLAGIMRDLKEGAVRIVVFFISIHLLYMAGVTAFHQVVRLFFIGGFVAMVLYVVAILTAYLTAFRGYATLKQVFAFSAANFLLAFPTDWLVKNTAVPDATSWSGFGLHTVLGFLILWVALVITRRGPKLLNQLPLRA